jgi:hypothetical protein
MNDNLYAVIIILMLLATLHTPPLLKLASKRHERGDLREPARRQIELKVSCWRLPSRRWSGRRYGASPDLLLPHSPEYASGCDGATSVAAHRPNTQLANN